MHTITIIIIAANYCCWYIYYQLTFIDYYLYARNNNKLFKYISSILWIWFIILPTLQIKKMRL